MRLVLMVFGEILSATPRAVDPYSQVAWKPEKQGVLLLSHSAGVLSWLPLEAGGGVQLFLALLSSTLYSCKSVFILVSALILCPSFFPLYSISISLFSVSLGSLSTGINDMYLQPLQSLFRNKIFLNQLCIHFSKLSFKHFYFKHLKTCSLFTFGYISISTYCQCIHYLKYIHKNVFLVRTFKITRCLKF